MSYVESILTFLQENQIFVFFCPEIMVNKKIGEFRFHFSCFILCSKYNSVLSKREQSTRYYLPEKRARIANFEQKFSSEKAEEVCRQYLIPRR